MRPVALLAVLALAAHAAGVTAQDKDAPPAMPAVSTAPVPTGAYQIDKAHTSLVFRVSHLGFSTYTGRFTGVDAKLQFNARNPAASQVNVDIDPRSIEADNRAIRFPAGTGRQGLVRRRTFPGDDVSLALDRVRRQRKISRARRPHPARCHATHRARCEVQRRIRRTSL